MTENMSRSEQESRFRALDEWFLSPSGRFIASVFNDELIHLKGLFRGDTIIQLGATGENYFFSAFQYRHQWLASPFLQEKATITSRFDKLPLERNSLDCIIAPLTLEAFPKSVSVLEEIERVLKPGGYVVFLGINALSLWGLWLRFSKNGCYGRHKSYAKSMFYLKHNLIHRGFVQCYLSVFHYIPPVKTKEWINRLSFLNQAGKMISPLPAGFYCLIMQKFNECPTLLVPADVNVKNFEVGVPVPCSSFGVSE